MNAIWIRAAQFLLSISFLVILHEMGHFIPARLFKIRVEKFYLFFDPWFSLFKKKIGNTEYGIGWLPLGGYVKIAGMVDESMDREQMKEPPKPDEFRSRPAWQRLIVMLGGVTVNLILGLIIYAAILFTWGREYIPIQNLKYGVTCDSLMTANGFRNGDQILSVAGVKPETLGDVASMILIDGHRKITVNRKGENKEITLPANIDQQILKSGDNMLFAPRFPRVIDSIIPGEPASKSSLQKGDRIVAVNGYNTEYGDSLTELIHSHKGQEIALTVLRNGQQVQVPVEVNDKGMIGVAFDLDLSKYFTIAHQNYSLLASIPAGINHGINTLDKYVRSMKLLFSKQGVKQIGGYGTIGKLFGATWDWARFWEMTAFISIILAFMNILPIPALDGGHVMFLLYEMIVGKAPNQKFMEYAQLAGMILLLLLVLYANGNDILRAFSH